jgi:receptor expression-enhancing protein 1/2/3/4
MRESLNRHFQGAGHAYDVYLRPFLATHEADIDRGVLEMRARAKSHLQAAVSLARTRVVEVVRRVSSQVEATQAR